MLEKPESWIKYQIKGVMIAFGVDKLQLNFGIKVWYYKIRVFFVIGALKLGQTRL